MSAFNQSWRTGFDYKSILLLSLFNELLTENKFIIREEWATSSAHSSSTEENKTGFNFSYNTAISFVISSIKLSNCDFVGSGVIILLVKFIKLIKCFK